MSHYHIVVNATKRQYLRPTAFGDGLQLTAFGASGCGTMTALAVLLAEDNGKGTGDLNTTDPLVGSWAGDNVRIVGDYGPPTMGPQQSHNHYKHAIAFYEDISERVIRLLCAEPFLKESLVQSLKRDAASLEEATRDALGFTAIANGRFKPAAQANVEEALPVGTSDPNRPDYFDRQEEQQRQAHPRKSAHEAKSKIKVAAQPDPEPPRPAPDLNDESVFVLTSDAGDHHDDSH
jgi:hypothetical protein